MSSRAEQEEAARATSLFQLELTKIGIETLSDSFLLWDHMPTSAAKDTAVAERWIAEAVLLVMSHRSRAAELARAYYRYMRALLTGYTVQTKDNPDRVVKLSDLRSQFEELTQDVAAKAPEKPVELTERTILSEDLGDVLDRLESDDEASAEEELHTVLEALGVLHQQALLDAIDKELALKDAEKLQQEAHDQAGARQAAASERVAMNGGRSTLWNHQQTDKRCLGWVRVSTTGTPCGWCAMLISRGFVAKNSALYTSEKSATHSYDDGDKYHDNCHCIAVPVFSKDQMKNDPRFELNRRYGELWPTVTQGLGGKDAVSAWRRFIRTEQAAAT